MRDVFCSAINSLRDAEMLREAMQRHSFFTIEVRENQKYPGSYDVGSDDVRKRTSVEALRMFALGYMEAHSTTGDGEWLEWSGA